MFPGQHITRTRNLRFLRLSLFGVFLLQALRGPSVGWDTENYIIGFNYYNAGRLYRNWEPLYKWLNYLICFFTDNAQWLLVITSLIIVLGYGIFIFENLEENQCAFWPVFFFITLNQFFVSTNLLRQSLAMAFGLNIYTVLRKDTSKRGIIKAAALGIIATQFHFTAFVCWTLALPFFFKTIKRSYIALIGVLSTISLYGFTLILTVFVTIFPKYAHYMSSKYMEDPGMSGYYLLTTALKILIVAIIFITLNPSRETNKKIYQLSFIIVMSIGIAILQTRTTLAVRLGYFLEVFMILIIPEFLRKIKKGSRASYLAYFSVFILGWVYFIYVMYVGSARGCVPYVFFWNQSY